MRSSLQATFLDNSKLWRISLKVICLIFPGLEASSDARQRKNFWRKPQKEKNLIFLDSWCPEIDKEHHFSLFFADLMQRRVTSSCRRNLEVKWSGQVQKLQSFMHLWRQSSSMYIIFIGPLNNGRAHDKSSRGCGFESQRLLGFSFLSLSLLPYFPSTAECLKSSPKWKCVSTCDAITKNGHLAVLPEAKQTHKHRLARTPGSRLVQLIRDKSF